MLARRLSNAEYDRTIHDLTGADLRPTREFPADGAGGEGFDNAAEALVLSPIHAEKYMEAAKLAYRAGVAASFSFLIELISISSLVD